MAQRAALGRLRRIQNPGQRSSAFKNVSNSGVFCPCNDLEIASAGNIVFMCYDTDNSGMLKISENIFLIADTY